MHKSIISKHAKEKMKRKEMTTISFVINVFKFSTAPAMENLICSETTRHGQHTVLQA